MLLLFTFNIKINIVIKVMLCVYALLCKCPQFYHSRALQGRKGTKFTEEIKYTGFCTKRLSGQGSHPSS